MVRGVKAVKAASVPETTFFCLSNANSVFISTILEVRAPRLMRDTHCASLTTLQSKGLQDLFTEIVTNPAEWDASGLLRLRRRVDPDGPQHACKVGCSPNMCKGT
jgi:pyridoxal phosphate phosphatase PHOSPHO2